MSSPPKDKADNSSYPGTPSTETKASTRKFFPRVKALLSEEYEEFLKQIILILEKYQVASSPTAGEGTAWNSAFRELYENVAKDYAVPMGKNRNHKFKEKMVELWSAMDSEVRLGVKKSSNSVYAMALNQWRVHSSLLKEKSKNVPQSSVTAIPQQSAKAIAHGDYEAAVQGNVEDEGRPRKKVRGADTRRISGGMASPGVMTSPMANQSPAVTGTKLARDDVTATVVAMPVELIVEMQTSLKRFESMLLSSGIIQPRLPSPLNELHRLKLQMPDAEFQTTVRRAYDKEINQYLSHVISQTRSASQPSVFPPLLEGLEQLRQTSQPLEMRNQIDHTHKQVISKYLKMLGGRGSQQAPAANTMALI